MPTTIATAYSLVAQLRRTQAKIDLLCNTLAHPASAHWQQQESDTSAGVSSATNRDKIEHNSIQHTAAIQPSSDDEPRGMEKEDWLNGGVEHQNDWVSSEAEPGEEKDDDWQIVEPIGTTVQFGQQNIIDHFALLRIQIVNQESAAMERLQHQRTLRLSILEEQAEQIETYCVEIAEAIRGHETASWSATNTLLQMLANPPLITPKTRAKVDLCLPRLIEHDSAGNHASVLIDALRFLRQLARRGSSHVASVTDVITNLQKLNALEKFKRRVGMAELSKLELTGSKWCTTRQLQMAWRSWCVHAAHRSSQISERIEPPSAIRSLFACFSGGVKRCKWWLRQRSVDKLSYAVC